MRKIVAFVKKHTILIILLAISILFPQSFSYQSKLNMRVLVTAIAVDKVQEDYEVTLQVVMPQAKAEQGSGKAVLSFITEQGKSISESIQKIAYKIGNTAALSHVSTVIVGNSLLDGNLTKELDYFIRNTEFNSAVMLLIAPESAKDMLKKTQNLEINEAIRLQKVFVYKESSLNGLMMPIVEFMNNSLTISGSSMASGILISNEGEEVLGQSTDKTLESQQSQQQGGGNQNGQESKESSNQQGGESSKEQNGRIKYYNDIYYFKNGKYVNKYDKEDEILGIFLSNRAPNTGELVVQNVKGDFLKDATIGCKFRQQETKNNIKFIDGKPILVIDMAFKDVKINEILNQGQPTPALYEFQAESSQSNIVQAIQERVESCVRLAYEKAKKDGVDILNIGDLAYRQKPYEWKEYYSKTGESYLSGTDIEVNVKVNNFN